MDDPGHAHKSFLESLHVDEDLSRGSDSFPEALSYFPDLQAYNLGPHGYLELIRAAKARVSIPVIASLNGVTPGGWIEYAELMRQAGADAIELNIYSIATDPMQSTELVEKRYLDLVTQVKQSVRIPIAVKLSPFSARRQISGSVCAKRVPTVLCCSTASTSPILTSRIARSCPRWC